MGQKKVKGNIKSVSRMFQGDQIIDQHSWGHFIVPHKRSLFISKKVFDIVLRNTRYATGILTHSLGNFNHIYCQAGSDG